MVERGRMRVVPPPLRDVPQLPKDYADPPGVA